MQLTHHRQRFPAVPADLKRYGIGFRATLAGHCLIRGMLVITNKGACIRPLVFTLNPDLGPGFSGGQFPQTS